MPEQSPLEEARRRVLLWVPQSNRESTGFTQHLAEFEAAAKAEAVEPFRQLLYAIEANKHDSARRYEWLSDRTGRLIAEGRSALKEIKSSG